MKKSKNKIHVAGPEDGEKMQIGNCEVTIKVKGETTGSTYALVEWKIPPGLKLPLATGRDIDRVFIVTKGPCLIQYYEKFIKQELDTFSVVHVPRGIKCSIKNPNDDKSVRVMTIYTPAGLEMYIKKLHALLTSGKTDIAKEFNSLNDTYGIEFEKNE